jgi:hypothetical protein
LLAVVAVAVTTVAVVLVVIVHPLSENQLVVVEL